MHIAPAEAGSYHEAEPCRILCLAPLPVDAEEDVADRADMSQLRAARTAVVEGAVQPSAPGHPHHQLLAFE